MRKKTTLARLFSAAALLALPLASWAQGGPVVFSQVYGGGGSNTAGPTYQRDFVEIYNRTSSTVNIGGYTVQYASSTSTFTGVSTAIPANTKLAPGQYYSIALGTTGTAGVALTTDFNGGTGVNLAAASGKVALVSNSTAIAANFIPPTAASTLVDLVGYGAANYGEGSTTTTATGSATTAAIVSTTAPPAGTAFTVTQSAVRKAGGATDTDNNRNDFTIGTVVAPHASVITVTAPTFSGTTPAGGSEAKNITLTNSSSSAKTVTLSLNTGTYFALGSTTATVPANGSTTVSLTYSPTVSGTNTDQLYTSFRDAGSDDEATGSSTFVTTQLSATAVSGGSANTALTITLGTFANTVIGAGPTSGTGFTLNNSGSTSQSVTLAITTTPIAPFALTTTTYTVPAGGSTAIAVTFSPTAGGTFSNTFTAKVGGYQDVVSGTFSAIGTFPPPTVTATSASSVLTGIQTVVILQGTNFSTGTHGTPAVNNTTATYNGSAVPVTVIASTYAYVTITPVSGSAPITITVNDGNANSGGTTSTSVTGVTPPTADVFEPFEGSYQQAYFTTPTVVALNSGNVTILQSLLSATDFSDKRNNSQAARIRGGGYVQFPLTSGVGSVSLSAALYGTDTGLSFTISYSTDGGTTFTAVTGTPATTALTTTLTAYGPYAINVPGNVIVRIANTNTTAGASARLDVDDVKISNFVATDLVVNSGQTVTQGGTYNSVTVQSGGVLTVASPGLVVASTITVSGRLNQNCQPITGTAAFMLNAGGTLGICDANGITTNPAAQGAIQVTGGRSYSADANYIYNGTAAQNSGSGLAGARSLTKLTTGALTLNSPVSVSQTATATGGNILSGGNLTLLSSASGTALAVSGSGNVTGDVTVQRYIGGISGPGYRMLAAPVSTTVNDLGASINSASATTYNSSPSPGAVTPFPTVFEYDQSRVGTVGSDLSAFNQGFFAVQAGRGLAAGDGLDYNTTGNKTVSFSGQLNNAAYTATLANDGNAAAGWALIGNPFAAPISWDAVTLGSNVSTTVYVSRATGQYSGVYTSYTQQSPIQVPPRASSIIPSGQAFFVHSTANSNNTLTIPTASRITTFDATLHPVQRQAADTRTALRLALTGAADQEPDYAALYFDERATTGYDVALDAVKLFNTGSNLNLYTSAADQAFALNALPALGTAAVLVPVQVRVPAAGTYTLSLHELDNLPAGSSLALRDALTGTSTVLTEGTSYRFSTSTTSATGRFTLVLNAAAAPLATASQALAAQVNLYPNPARGQFRLELPVLSAAQVAGGVHAELLNVLGQVVRQLPLRVVAGQASQTDVSVAELGAGIYQLRLTVNGTQAVRRVVVE